MKRFFRVVDLSTESVSSRAKTAKKIREVQVSMPASTRPRFVGAPRCRWVVRLPSRTHLRTVIPSTQSAR